MHDFAPIPRWPRYFPHDDGLYFHRRPKTICNDPHTHTWFPEDEENIRMVSNIAFYLLHFTYEFVLVEAKVFFMKTLF